MTLLRTADVQSTSAATTVPSSWQRPFATGLASQGPVPRSSSRESVAEGVRGKLQRAGADELWSREIFDTVREARVLYQGWRHRYNHHHPHSALGWMTPAAFAAAELGKRR